jgi:hypothetical protein
LFECPNNTILTSFWLELTEKASIYYYGQHQGFNIRPLSKYCEIKVGIDPGLPRK